MAAPATHAQGIDLSHWNSTYNALVRPVDFAFLKSSEGVSWHDPKFNGSIDLSQLAA